MMQFKKSASKFKSKNKKTSDKISSLELMLLGPGMER